MQTQTLENKGEQIAPYNDVAELIDDKLKSLSQSYEITEKEKVKNFLVKYRFLISLLEEIPEKISQYFENNQKLVLKLSYEPDSSNFAELWVQILTELSAKEAMRILDKFDDEWWLEKMDETYGNLNITLKFI